MKFSIKTGYAEKLTNDCLVVGVFESEKLSESAKLIDKASEKAISTVLDSGDMRGKLASTLILRHLPNIAASRVLLVGLGKEKELDETNYRKVISAATKAVTSTGAKNVAFLLTEVTVKKHDMLWRTSQLAEVVIDTTYKVNAIKSKKDDADKLVKIDIIVQENEVNLAETGLKQGLALGAGVTLTKDLGNLPPNICTPTYLADQAKVLGKEYDFKVDILDQPALEKLGMGSFLSVSKGSRQPPKLIVIQHHKGKKKDKPVVLVGKGITFDTGGISLKPAADMDEMKYDMCGAASVLGIFKTLGEMDLPLNVIGIIPACENMPDGMATRPGDVVTSMSGQTIEILNTDAEGRLILCDALTYAERFEPAAVVDIATLTGACVIALGHHASGLYSNVDKLAHELLAAGHQAHDRAWHMPLWEDYQNQLDSNFADMANIGGRAGGSITAACFLSRFTKKYDWAHLDIAGTAWVSGKAKGATGRPVPLLAQFLIGRSSK